MSFPISWSWLVVRDTFVALLLLAPSLSSASQTVAAADEETSIAQAEVAATAPADAEEAKREAQKKRKVRIAIIVGGLVAGTGIALIALTMLGGSATRRRLRRRPLNDLPVPSHPLPADRFDDPDDISETAGPLDLESPDDRRHPGDSAP